MHMIVHEPREIGHLSTNYAPRHPVDLDKLASDIVQPLDELVLTYSDICKLRRLYRGGLWRMQ